MGDFCFTSGFDDFLGPQSWVNKSHGKVGWSGNRVSPGFEVVRCWRNFRKFVKKNRGVGSWGFMGDGGCFFWGTGGGSCQVTGLSVK